MRVRPLLCPTRILTLPRLLGSPATPLLESPPPPSLSPPLCLLLSAPLVPRTSSPPPRSLLESLPLMGPTASPRGVVSAAEEGSRPSRVRATASRTCPHDGTRTAERGWSGRFRYTSAAPAAAVAVPFHWAYCAGDRVGRAGGCTAAGVRGVD